MITTTTILKNLTLDLDKINDMFYAASKDMDSAKFDRLAREMVCLGNATKDLAYRLRKEVRP